MASHFYGDMRTHQIKPQKFNNLYQNNYLIDLLQNPEDTKSVDNRKKDSQKTCVRLTERGCHTTWTTAKTWPKNTKFRKSF
jgi:hypothetical protein